MGDDSMTRAIRWIALTILVAACGPGTTLPIAAPSSTPASTVAAFQLNLAPGDLGCDTIGVDYREVTFKIDPAASEPVTAITNTGIALRTFWSLGFVGGWADNKVVFDPAGAVVVADGDKLAIPAAAFPRLKGYFVCPSPDALYILVADPQ
jgi:hypothetical protein